MKVWTYVHNNRYYYIPQLTHPFTKCTKFLAEEVIDKSYRISCTITTNGNRVTGSLNIETEEKHQYSFTQHILLRQQNDSDNGQWVSFYRGLSKPVWLVWQVCVIKDYTNVITYLNRHTKYSDKMDSNNIINLDIVSGGGNRYKFRLNQSEIVNHRYDKIYSNKHNYS